jgi:hypothetical protein
MNPAFHNRCAALVAGTLLLGAAHDVRAADTAAAPAAFESPQRPLAAVLPPARWRQVEQSVDRALAWLATQQNPDGSFPTATQGQPGVTSLCIMAFLSRGHQPGIGPYGDRLDHAIDYVLSCQMSDGLFSREIPGPVHVPGEASHTASYNHAISGLMLGEVYGEVSGARARAVKQAIVNALAFTRTLQTRDKPAADRGGWRYLRVAPQDSDLSVTAWQLMFLRSAKNAEFDVPAEWIDEAMDYVRRCWDPNLGMFCYSLPGGHGAYASRSMVGAGILSLSLGGQHGTAMAQSAGDWLVQHPFSRFGEKMGPFDRFFYGTYYCSQAAAQLGGKYWESFFPKVSDLLLVSQSSDGSWPVGENGPWGRTYSTAMAVLSLTPPYQLLPVYQR